MVIRLQILWQIVYNFMINSFKNKLVMVFVACGLNHKTAPVEVREKVALSAIAQNSMLVELLAKPGMCEAILLSTCNRTEIYCYTYQPELLVSWLAQMHNIPAEELAPYMYLHEGTCAVQHALRVATGMDSMMLGEPQILGQMKQAYQTARDLGAATTHLRPCFEFIFSAAKRIRTRSGIGNNPVSVAYAAAQLINQTLPETKNLKVMLIGSGETAALVAKYLQQQGVTQFIIANRTLEKAQQLAKTFGGETIHINNLSQFLPQADVVVTATTCPIPFINKSLVAHTLAQRNNHPMLFVDLAVPRDIEADISDLEQVTLFNIDDLQNRVDANLHERRLAATHAEELVQIELQKYLRKQRSLKANEVICDYRSQMRVLAEKELQRALKKLSAGQCQKTVLNEFSERLINKLTHKPTTGLKYIARDGREDLFTLAQYLFNPTHHQSSYEEIP